MSASTLLADLRNRGNHVTLTDAGQVSIRPPIGEGDRVALVAVRPALVAALNAEQWCHRCKRRHDRLVLAYWSQTERYCSECCEHIANDMDRRRTWPTPPWTTLTTWQRSGR